MAFLLTLCNLTGLTCSQILRDGSRRHILSVLLFETCEFPSVSLELGCAVVPSLSPVSLVHQLDCARLPQNRVHVNDAPQGQAAADHGCMLAWPSKICEVDARHTAIVHEVAEPHFTWREVLSAKGELTSDCLPLMCVQALDVEDQQAADDAPDEHIPYGAVRLVLSTEDVINGKATGVPLKVCPHMQCRTPPLFVSLTHERDPTHWPRPPPV